MSSDRKIPDTDNAMAGGCPIVVLKAVYTPKTTPGQAFPIVLFPCPVISRLKTYVINAYLL